MKRSWKVVMVAAAVAVIGGYGAGSVIAANADDTPAKNLPISSVKDGKFPVNIAPLRVIGNGQTAGSWRPDTPVKDRPDFMPVVLDDGTHGYVKRTDIDDELVLPVLPDGVMGKIDKEALVTAQSRQRNVMVQPNANGEVWVPVYAADGVTVVGKKLMDDVSDPESSQD